MTAVHNVKEFLKFPNLDLVLYRIYLFSPSLVLFLLDHMQSHGVK